MMIKSIDINNYHGIEKLHLDLEDGMNLLIGNNGAGKTSLLNALAAVLQEPVKWLHGYNQYRPIENTDAFVSTKEISGTVMQETAHYPVSVDGILVFDKREFHCDQMMESAASGATSQSYDLTNIFTDRFGDASRFLYYAFCRRDVRKYYLSIRIASQYQMGKFSASGDTITPSTGYPSSMISNSGAFTWSLPNIRENSLSMNIRHLNKLSVIL